jgi:hypothetical protein
MTALRKLNSVDEGDCSEAQEEDDVKEETVVLVHLEGWKSDGKLAG